MSEGKNFKQGWKFKKKNDGPINWKDNVNDKHTRMRMNSSCDCDSHLPLVLRPVTAETPSKSRGCASHSVFL